MHIKKLLKLLIFNVIFLSDLGFLSVPTKLFKVTVEWGQEYNYHLCCGGESRSVLVSLTSKIIA